LRTSDGGQQFARTKKIGEQLGKPGNSASPEEHSLWRRAVLKQAANRERINMKPLVLGGILLILLGIIALSYNRITYTTEEKIAEIGPLKATAEREKSIPLPPVLGGLLLIAGIGVVVAGYKK
jgi:hypothetical protein